MERHQTLLVVGIPDTRTQYRDEPFNMRRPRLGIIIKALLQNFGDAANRGKTECPAPAMQRTSARREESLERNSLNRNRPEHCHAKAASNRIESLGFDSCAIAICSANGSHLTIRTLGRSFCCSRMVKTTRLSDPSSFEGAAPRFVRRLAIQVHRGMAQCPLASLPPPTSDLSDRYKNPLPARPSISSLGNRSEEFSDQVDALEP